MVTLVALSDDFTNQYLGHGVEVEDPSNMDQCMDWAFAWCDKLGIPHSAIRHLYAYEVYTEASDETRQYFDVVRYSNGAYPPPGALVVFSNALGVAGHIALAISSSSAGQLYTSDQNWNYKPYIQKVTHNYNAVLGWLIPKKLNQGTVPMVDRNMAIDLGVGILGRSSEAAAGDTGYLNSVIGQPVDVVIRNLVNSAEAKAFRARAASQSQPATLSPGLYRVQ